MKRFLGMLLCFAAACVLFFLTRGFLDPAEVARINPNTESVVEKRCKQSGFDYSKLLKKEKQFTAAPDRKEDIPAALRQYFLKEGYDPSGNGMTWMVTKRFMDRYFSEPVSKALTKTPVAVYRFLPMRDAYVVAPQRPGSAMIVVMGRESGRWKIDNLVPSTTHDWFLNADFTNWDCELQYDFR